MPRLTDLVCFVRLETVQRVPVLEREHCDGLRTELICRSESPDRNLTAVGNENLGEHVLSSPATYRSANI